ncbi:MAG: peptide chain release factor N(5)-glutamine methyltransferase [Lentisphaeria bacterium]|nr:peptide chain release factor N(5)-glutamine methyltransferase [Lentisphaeria bacterium]
MNDLISEITRILSGTGIENFIQEARWIAGESPTAQTALERAKRRAAGEPLQYILGTAPFRNLMLKVDPRVLIPRPETELLAQWLIDNAPENASVLDLGCGSGAIAIATATERPDLDVTAVDISTDALTLAKENARECQADNITFVNSDIFSGLAGRKFDLIGANLPYVTEDEYLSLPGDVRNFEPKNALTAPENGLFLIRKTISQMRSFFKPGGGAIFELSPEQADITADFAAENDFKSGIIYDLCGRKRFVTALLES